MRSPTRTVLSTVRPLTQSWLAPVLLSVAALIASLIRWHLQGSHNMYTAIAKRFYVPDPDLGWRVSTQHPIWLGLDACAMIAAVAFVLAVTTVVIQRRAHTRRTRMTILRVVSWSVALLSLTVPAAAFVSGPGPLRGRDTLPPSAAVLIESGIEGAIDAPAGTYAVVSHPGTSVTARLLAGGEAFDARFARDITGTWQGNPRDLSRPMHAEVGVATASVDTGIAERSKHAREGYLQADKFPQITVALDRVTAVRANGLQQVVFRAPGTVRLMGRSHPVEITGRMQKPDDAARERLGLIGDVLLVQADFTLAINETALASKSRDFDGDRIPLHVSLVLRHTGN